MERRRLKRHPSAQRAQTPSHADFVHFSWKSGISPAENAEKRRAAPPLGSTAGPKERGEQGSVDLPDSGSRPDKIKNKRNGAYGAPLRLFFNKEETSEDLKIGGKIGVGGRVGLRLLLWGFNLSGTYVFPFNDKQKQFFGEKSYPELTIGFGL